MSTEVVDQLRRINDPAYEQVAFYAAKRIAKLEAFKQRIERAHAAWMGDKISTGDAMGEMGRALIEIEAE